MIVFSIALKSKQVSDNWDYTCGMLERTLNSIYNQTDRDFKVVIVCHEKPDLSSSYSNLTYYQVDFAPPQKIHREMLLDRDVKELIGRKVSKELNSDYIMAVDSDDCISQRIAEFINQNAKSSIVGDGFFANQGYIFYEKSQKVVPKNGLYHCCGSTVALKSELYGVPNSWKYEDIVQYKVDGNFFSHGDLVKYWQSQGKAIEQFPFKSCIYVMADIEQNLSYRRNTLFSSIRRKDVKLLLSPLKRRVTKFLNSQNITQDIKDEFGLYPLDQFTS